jgi:hypothetical protein
VTLNLVVGMTRSCPRELELDLLLLPDYVFRGPIQDAAARYGEILQLRISSGGLKYLNLLALWLRKEFFV